MGKIFVGIDLGATNVKIGCFDGEINLIEKTSVPTNHDAGPEAVVEIIGEATEKLLADSGLSKNDLAAIGIGSTGQFNLKKGIMYNNPNMHLFKNVPLRKMVSDRLGKPVVLDNDGNAACWGEHIAGAGRGVKDMAFFTLGSGIGGGLISDGKLVHGFNDNAAELGHMIIYPDGRLCGCGQRGCVEAYASANSTAARAAEAIEAGAESSLKKVLDQKGRITSKDVYQHLETGDALAKQITDGTAKALAIICVNMVHSTEPARIVFSGGMIAAGDVLLNRIKEYFNEQVWTLKAESVEICFATVGEDTGIIGAAALARDARDG